MRKLIGTVCMLLAVAAAYSPVAFAAVVAPGFQALLDAAAPDTEIPVIVTMADRVDTAAFKDRDLRQRRRNILIALRGKAASRLPPLKAFLQNNEARRVRELWIINGMAAILKASAIKRLSAQPGVASIRLDETIYPPEVMQAGASPVEWNIAASKAPPLWDLGFTGAGIVVAGMDTGVDPNHSDLIARWRGGANSWYDPNGEHASAPYDYHGHGTGTTALMVGGDATGSAIGMAPGAQWIAVKIFNDAGEADTSVIHMGFQWLLDPDGNPATDDAPHVVNNSWGYTTLVNICFLEFQYDIQALKNSGIIVVFSAGNNGPSASTSISPANNPESFAVGAVDQNLSIAGFSSRGPSACNLENDFFPEVVAPGVDIKTADKTLNGIFPAAFAYVSGTSFAAPHVSGAAALLLQAFPGLAPSDIETALKQSAQDLGAAGPDDVYGHGMIDVQAAYLALIPRTDADGDGYFAESLCSPGAICGTPQDCNDADPGIYPGATETKHDGIDQDCNGYDLTIDIASASYRSDTGMLKVLATSALADAAGLQVEGFGPMTWNAGQSRWELNAASGSNPGTVVVSGVEGAASAATTACSNTCPADLTDDGAVNFADLAILRANFGANCTTLPPETKCPGDITGDRYVNFADLARLRAAFGSSGCIVCE